MAHTLLQLIKRFVRWLFGAPFQRLPAPFGNTVPADMQLFQSRVEEAQRQGIGRAAEPVPVRHTKTRPARLNSALERQ